MPRGGEDALEDLGLAPDVELRRGLIEEHHARAEPHGAQGPRQSHTLPLPTRKFRPPLVAARQDGVELREPRRARIGERGADDVLRRAGGCDVVSKRQLEPDEVLEDRCHP